MLYEDFIESHQAAILDYFKNVSTFKNQFCFDGFNQTCYECMYEYNAQESIKTVKDLKAEIPELAAVCKECGPYFSNPRNKSIKGYDVQMGIFIEDQLIEFLNQNLHLKAMHADKKNKRYPDCMILDTDKGILAYFEVKYHAAPFINAIHKTGRYCYEGSVTLDFDKIVKQIEIIESDLDRPTFYLHWVDFPCIKGLFYETSEQVKNNLYEHGSEFEREEREGDYCYTAKVGYLKKFYSPLLEMGTFEGFVEQIRSMKGAH